jgi:hypothetical protein
MICPDDPAAVAIPKAMERCSSQVLRPTAAIITPNPVTAMPKPTKTSKTYGLPVSRQSY